MWTVIKLLLFIFILYSAFGLICLLKVMSDIKYNRPEILRKPTLMNYLKFIYLGPALMYDWEGIKFIFRRKR